MATIKFRAAFDADEHRPYSEHTITGEAPDELIDRVDECPDQVSEVMHDVFYKWCEKQGMKTVGDFDLSESVDIFDPHADPESGCFTD